MVKGIGYSRSEVEKLLNIMEDKLPCSGELWECIQQRLAEACCNANGKIEKECPVDSLNCKFSSLYNNKKPTGDPNCLPEVHCAKRLLKIESEMGFSDSKGMINNPLNDSRGCCHQGRGR
jgi:hypothetical protein